MPDFLTMEIFLQLKLPLRGQFKIASCFLSWHSIAKKNLSNLIIEVFATAEWRFEVFSFQHKGLGCSAVSPTHPGYQATNNKILGNIFALKKNRKTFFHGLLRVKHKKSAGRLKALLMLLTRIQTLWTRTVLVPMAIRRSNHFLLQRCFVNNKRK